MTGPGAFELTGNFSGEWITLKDHYFPTWVAEENGKRLRIEESNLGTLLIKTEPGSVIRLYHEPFLYERLLSIVSMASIIAIFVIAFLLGKRHDASMHENH